MFTFTRLRPIPFICSSFISSRHYLLFRTQNTMYSKRASEKKIFFLVSLAGLFIYILLSFYAFHTAYTAPPVNNIHTSQSPFAESTKSVLEEDLKYILIYTADVKHNSRSHFKEGRHHFLDHRCFFNNCYLTTREHVLNKDIRSFDAVVINVTDLFDMVKLPDLRTVSQKYVFYGMESSDRAPICREDTDNYFNWTWSYKLYSDIVSPFFLVKNFEGKVVAPKFNVKWSQYQSKPGQLAETKREYEYYWERKKHAKAVATIIKNCNETYGKIYIKKLRGALEKYKLELDVFGCDKECPGTEGGCDNIISSGYFFYLVQENTLTEDYLTDKVLNAYFNGAVPIIKSGAMLTKFLPTGSYINALHVTPEETAAIVDYIIGHPKIYLSYFRWKEFYTFHRTKEFEGICQLCELLNDKRWVNNYRAYDDFRKWWYKGPLDEMCGKKITTKIGL